MDRQDSNESTGQRAVLFDLDGTLVDHFRAIAEAIRYAQRRLGLPESSDAVVHQTVGGGLTVTLGRLCGPENAVAVRKLFDEHFQTIFLTEVAVLPGTVELLRHLRAHGWKTGVLTNKDATVSRQLLAHLGLSSLFDGIFGFGDTPWPKPDVRFTQFALQQLGLSASAVCLVGDSTWDAETAHHAGMVFYGVTTGTHSAEALQKAGATVVASGLEELGQRVFALPCPA